MMKQIWLISLFLAISVKSAKSDGATAPSPEESSAKVARVETLMDQAQQDFSAQLQSMKLSPEARAIRIEQWQHAQTALREQARVARAALARKKTPAMAAVAESEATVEVASSEEPVQADIHQIEADIQAFQASLDGLSPEVRATQVEQFLQLNQEVFAELKNLQRQAALSQTAAVAPQALEQKAPASETSALQTEMDRILQDLSTVDPETRSQYIEKHAATLNWMVRQLSEAEVPANPTPENASILPQTPHQP